MDTHIWVSFFFRNRFQEILQKINIEDGIIYTCSEQLHEFAGIHAGNPKIAKMLPLKTQTSTRAMRFSCADFPVQKRYSLLMDYKDNYLVDLANQTNSAFVSNDKGFLILKN
ncbi:MAG: putative toxin-antitoxin system toxin component, PIN family [Chitinophagales bacterium]|nr:putative toxin-antitoxin system toxin component, PIN family [Chitinophagales bacterium]